MYKPLESRFAVMQFPHVVASIACFDVGCIRQNRQINRLFYRKGCCLQIG
jgi:hypothetical protein